MRQKVQEEKAVLCKLIDDLVRKPPQNVIDGSIQKVRLWRAHQAKCRMICANSRSSVRDLEGAYQRMLNWETME